MGEELEIVRVPGVLEQLLTALEETILAKVPEGSRPAARLELRAALAGAQADGYRIGWRDCAITGPARSLADLLEQTAGTPADVPDAEPVAGPVDIRPVRRSRHVHVGCGLDCNR
jgi:hypothetical protein